MICIWNYFQHTFYVRILCSCYINGLNVYININEYNFTKIILITIVQDRGNSQTDGSVFATKSI